MDPITTGTAAATWLWGKYGDQLLERLQSLALEHAKKAGRKLTTRAEEKITREIREHWQGFEWDKAARIYCHRMRESYSTMRVLGMSGPVPLENVFTEVYILDQISGLRRKTVEDLLREQDQSKDGNSERRAALDVVGENRRLFILGKPGAGKTTLMKWMVIQATDGKLEKTPIFVSLKDWSDSREPELLAFIAREFRIHGFPNSDLFVESLLAEGKAMVMLDGLDEVNVGGGNRERVIRQVRDFAEMYHDNPCIVTCRVAATDYQFEKFTYVELADFSTSQVEQFALNWFREKEQLAEGFKEAMNDRGNKDLRDLARTPLLLTLLCLNYEETLSFPKRRIEIYEEAIDALLKKWDASRGIKRDKVYRSLSLGRKRQLLERLAAESFENRELYSRKRIIAKRIVRFLETQPRSEDLLEADGEAVLQAIEAQHGLLITRAVGIASFSHKTFQEYFTARYIRHDHSRGFGGIVQRNGYDDGWHEVLMMVASLLEPESSDLLFAEWSAADQTRLTLSSALRGIANWIGKNTARERGTTKALKRSEYLTLALALDHSLDQAADRSRQRIIGVSYDKALDFGVALGADAERCLDFALARALRVALDKACLLDSTIGLGRNLRFQLEGHLERALGEARELDPDLDKALRRTRGRTLDRSLDLDLALDRARDIALDRLERGYMERGLSLLYLTIAHISRRFSAEAKYVIAKARDYVDSHDLKLGFALESLSVPAEFDAMAWNAFLASFRGMLKSHADIGHGLRLTDRDHKTLSRYLMSQKRMLECLEVASVSDRQAIRDSVLSLPEES